MSFQIQLKSSMYCCDMRIETLAFSMVCCDVRVKTVAFSMYCCDVRVETLAFSMYWCDVRVETLAFSMDCCDARVETFAISIALQFAIQLPLQFQTRRFEEKIFLKSKRVEEFRNIISWLGSGSGALGLRRQGAGGDFYNFSAKNNALLA